MWYPWHSFVVAAATLPFRCRTQYAHLVWVVKLYDACPALPLMLPVPPLQFAPIPPICLFTIHIIVTPLARVTVILPTL